MVYRRKNYLFDLSKYEKSIYSQNEQDGILQKLFAHIPPVNTPPLCIEFGFPSHALGEFSNSANLVLNKGWKCLLFDISHENPEINLHKAFITSENVCGLFEKHQVPRKFEYLCIDIDSTDLWVLAAVLKKFQPLVLTVEYNACFPFKETITFPNNLQEFWEEDTVFGCSVGAIALVAKQFHYKIVYVGAGDVYLVHQSCVKGLHPLPLHYFSKILKRAPQKNHASCTSGREKIMIDYSVWLKTKDESKARAAAQPISEKYLK